jgi:alanyl-tRNA synthetase
VWNLVFTQFDRKDRGILEPLPNKNIDTGMGLERIARVMQEKKTNFEIDSFVPIIDAIINLSKTSVGADPCVRPKINAIADHIRAVTFAIGDGVLPSNEERGYVIRKLIRRAFWYGRSMGTKGQPFLYKLVPIVAKVTEGPYPELTGQREDIVQVVLAEEERFRNALQEGLERLEAMVEDSKAEGVLSGEDVFKLYDTYGLPLELTQEIAASENIRVDIRGFENRMQEQRVKSREASKIISESIFAKDALEIELTKFKTPFVEDKEEIETKVLLKEKDNIFLEKTNFYGEKGGQVGDTGWLIKDNKIIADVIDAVDIAGRVQHKLKMKKGVLKTGDIVILKIDKGHRENIRKNHTATHLLHYALRKVLGQHVKQAGSLVASDRLRFDFRHFKAVTEDELARVGDIVNEDIRKNSPVCVKELTLGNAKKEGAIALFGEKYGETVRMVSIGDYSKELCGGTHVARTGDIKKFKIISESSIASGVRRIEAVTGDEAENRIGEERNLIKQIADELKTSPDNILQQIEKMSNRIKRLEKVLEEFSAKSAKLSTKGLIDRRKTIKGYDVIIAEVKDADMALLRKSADAIKACLKKSVFVLVSEKDGRISMVVGAPLPLDAVKMLNNIGSGFGIKGGGRSDFSQAGSRSGLDIKKLLEKAEEIIKREIG